MTRERDAELNIADLGRVLRERKAIFFFLLALCVGASIFYSYSQPVLYRAEARVVVNPLRDPRSSLVQPVDALTESQLIASEPVALGVQKQLDSEEGPNRLLQGLDVTGASSQQPLYAQAQVLVVRYTDSDADFAKSAANAFAENYITYRRRQALRALRTIQETLQKRIRRVSADLAETTDRLQEAAEEENATLVPTLEIQRNALVTRLGILQQRLDDAQPDENARTGGAQLIQSASTPRAPASPNSSATTVFGIIAGVLLGMIGAMIRERMDTRIKSREELETLIAAPVLGSIPRFEEGRVRRRVRTPLVTLTQTHAAASEAYRSLRTNMAFVAGERALSGIAVTSPAASEGKTATTANLGILLARTGHRTILVSGDLRRPTLEHLFGVDESPGLSDFLTSDHPDPWSFVTKPGVENLRIVPSGGPTSNPDELLTSERFLTLIRALKANSDFVLVDTPPILAVADAGIIAARLDGALLVVRARQTPRTAIVHAAEEMNRAGGVVIGSVLNGVDPNLSPYSYGGYYGPVGKRRGDAADKSGNGSASRAGLRSAAGSD